MLLLLPFELWLSQVAAAWPELHVASAQKVNQISLDPAINYTHTQTHMCQAVCVCVCQHRLHFDSLVVSFDDELYIF